MLRGWLGGSRDASPSMAVDQEGDLEDAMSATIRLFNDEIEEAETLLRARDSTFHQAGLGVSTFIRAVLGFERDVMKEALDQLTKAETKANHSQRHTPHLSNPSLYSEGAVYRLMIAEIHLMVAVLGVLTENVADSVTGFFKVRRALISLEALIAEEKSFVMSTRADDPEITPTVSNGKHGKDDNMKDDNDSDEFFDADGEADAEGSGATRATLQQDLVLVAETEKLAIRNSTPDPKDSSPANMRGPDPSNFTDRPLDEFIHTGINLCLGLLLLMLSLLPPAFATLTKIVGVSGDRRRGIAYLWQATRFSNTNGALAGLLLLGYSSNLIGFCDIIPTGAYPKDDLKKLVDKYTQLYPKSRLWRIEHSRMISTPHALEDALEIVQKLEPAQLLQVEALQTFEGSLLNTYLHRHQAAAKGFTKMTELNKWSHAMYFFAAGGALVELYREHGDKNPEEASKVAKEASELFEKAQSSVGKRTIMSRPLPFDVWITKKVDKWKARAKKYNIDLVDAVGVSPAEELIYLWNGYRRMDEKDRQASMSKLQWSSTAEKAPWAEETVDEDAAKALLCATILRRTGQRDEAMQLLRTEILVHNRDDFKNGLQDNWPLPIAHYEMAVCHWNIYQGAGGQRKDLEEVEKHLDTASKWGDYDMCARFGIRIRVGTQAVKRAFEDLNSAKA